MARRPSPAATGSTSRRGRTYCQKATTWPPCRCGPGSSRSDGGTTGAPARAAWDATASSRITSSSGGPSGYDRPLETRATGGGGRRGTSTCQESRRTPGSSLRSPCSAATSTAALTALSLIGQLLPDERAEGVWGNREVPPHKTTEAAHGG